jgi:hypothetical protein
MRALDAKDPYRAAAYNRRAATNSPIHALRVTQVRMRGVKLHDQECAAQLRRPITRRIYTSGVDIPPFRGLP